MARFLTLFSRKINWKWMIVGFLALFFIFSNLVKRLNKDPLQTSDKIIILPLDGVITMERGALMKGESVDSIVSKINQWRDDSAVKALVIRLNTPGGSVAAVQEIVLALQKFKAKGKFVVSSFGDVSASGGYYIGSASDKIVSLPGTLTGSIGVIMQRPDVSGLLGKIGVNYQTIKSGTMKDAGSPFRNMTDDEKKYFQELIMDAYSQFYDQVKSGRKMEDAVLKPLADGRVFTGKKAFEYKLVDRLGGLEDAIEEAKLMAGLSGKKPRLIWSKEKKSLDRLFEILGKAPNLGILNSSLSSLQLMYILE
jgi:protease-4